MKDRSPAQQVAGLLGIVFVAVGILGFIPGITTNYGDMSFAGHDSGAELLGIFQVSVLHNLVHILFGIVGLALARTFEGAKLYLLAGGVVYLVLWVFGIAIDKDGGANFVPLNSADDWLHLVLGVSLIGLGLITTRMPATRTAQ
jgi:hypothetical protein